jgi:23S rRNA (adenine-N6)-dimethyltransferase
VADRRARSARSGPPRSQHFLRTAEIAAELVRAAGIGSDDLVVDLGAGRGRLTSELARVARRVIAVELDPALAASLRGHWANVEVIEGDAAEFRLPREPFRVVANLPFAQTNELLRMLFDDPTIPILRADLVVEWGVAVKRTVPWPSSVSGVVWNATYETLLARRLPPSAFEPPPSVAAGDDVFRRRNEPLVPRQKINDYHRFVSTGFRHGLRRVAPAAVVRRVADPGVIPRDLDAFQWATLYRLSRVDRSPLNP